MAVFFNKNKINMSMIKLRQTKHEVIATIGRRTGQRKKIATIAVYIPPWYNAYQNRSVLDFISESITAIKRKYNNPHIIVAGDFNQGKIRDSVKKHPDIKVIPNEATRNNEELDQVATSLWDVVVDKGTIELISTPDGVTSDHRVVQMSFRMPRVSSYEIQKYSNRLITDEGCLRFGQWARSQSWGKVLGDRPVSEAVENLHKLFEEGMDVSFEKKRNGQRKRVNQFG